MTCFTYARFILSNDARLSLNFIASFLVYASILWLASAALT